MTVRDIYVYFHRLADDSDTTFLTDADVEGYLSMAYKEFRDLVCQTDPDSYMTWVDIVLPGIDNISLANIANPVVIMGPGTLTGPRLMRLEGVSLNPTATTAGTPMTCAPTLQDLQYIDRSYMLRGSVLHFSASIAGTIRVYYVGDETVNWTKHAPTDVGVLAEFVDDYSQYHDIIPMIAYKNFSMRDWSLNPAYEQRYAARIERLLEFVATGRASHSHRVVAPDNRWDY